MCEVVLVLSFFLPLLEPSNTFLSYLSKLTAYFSLFNLVLLCPKEGFLLGWVDNIHNQAWISQTSRMQCNELVSSTSFTGKLAGSNPRSVT